jgi:hypothetical protein
MADFLSFVTAKNLSDPNLVPGKPWEFCVADEDNPFKKLPKDKRRLVMLKPTTNWQVYSAFEGFAPNLRISKSNPPQKQNGLVAD